MHAPGPGPNRPDRESSDGRAGYEWLLDSNGLTIPDALIGLGYGSHPLPNHKFQTLCLGPGDLRKVDCKHKVPPIQEPCDKPKQVGARAFGPVCHPSWTCRTCVCNWHNAMCNRHAATQPICDKKFVKGDYQREMSRAYTWFQKRQFEFASNFDCSLELELGWLHKWPVLKQTAIMRSWRNDALRLNALKCMVKREAGHKCPTKARNIQFYMNFVTQEATGPYITRLQKAFQKTYDGDVVTEGISVTYAGGLNAVALGKWMERALARGNRWFYERDGKNWDSTMHHGHFAFKRAIYCLGGLGDWYDKVLRASENCKGTYRSATRTYRYKVKGTTKSGHNDTSLGNSVINAGIAVEAMLRLGLRGDILVMGDDILIAIDSDFDAEKLADVERDLGIIPEYRKFTDWNQVSFISGIWLPAKAGLCFTALPGRILARLMYTTSPWSDKDMPGWATAVCTGLAPTLGGVPVVGAWLEICNPKKQASITIEHEMQHKLDLYSSQVEWDDKVWHHLAARYQMTEVELLDLHRQVLGLPRGRWYHRVLGLEHIIAVDTADVTERPVSAISL